MNAHDPDRDVFLADVMTHPRHQAMQQMLVVLVEQVRACRTDRDGYELQQELLARLLEVEEDRGAFSRAVKRMAKGGKPQAGLPEPPSGNDPADILTWKFERDLCERLGRQLRSLGDALAWRAFGFNRRILLAWCRNMPAGPMAGKDGLDAERRFIDERWREHGCFVLLHDLTNCLRIGDATEWTPDAGGPRIVEIKTNKRRTDPRQKQRIAAAHAALYEGATLPGDHLDERLHDLGLPLRTHLDLLRTATERAAAEGIFALDVPGSRALVAVDLYGVSAKGWTQDEYHARLQRVWQAAKRCAGIDGRPELNIHATSFDSVSRDPLRVPWAVYPLDPVISARLIGDAAVFIVETSGPRLAQDLTDRGIPATWVRRPQLGGALRPAEVVMEVGETQQIPAGAGFVLEFTRKLQTQRSQLDRYLIELMHQDSLIAGIEHLLGDPETSQRPWPVYRDEHLVWA